MKEERLIEKHKTGIIGLDQLFYGGLQLKGLSISERSEKGLGTLIVIKGERLCHKTILAMQLMHGITKSINNLRNAVRCKNHAKFYSLVESKGSLSDSYLDLIITKMIEKMIRETVSDKSEEDKPNDSQHIGNLWKNNLMTRALFKVEDGMQFIGSDSSPKIPTEACHSLDVLLSERCVYYSTRTNALHFKVPGENDSRSNLLFYRRSDNVDGYETFLKPLPSRFKEEFVVVDFDGNEAKISRGGGESVYSKTSTIRFQDIINDFAELGQIIEDDNAYPYPCVVIDGLSDICDENLKSLPFTHISTVLRKSAPVSILVFDERYDDIRFDADVIIDVKSCDDDETKYTYNKLRIEKCSFQSFASGWHHYKRRDTGIEVFPSLHRILQRREYLTRISTYTHQGVLEETYEEYLAKNCQTQQENVDYRNYKDSQKETELDHLRNMYVECSQNQFHNYNSRIRDNHSVKRILLWHPDGNEVRKSQISALIGNPNSYKRFVSMAKVFSMAKAKEHTLVVLFNKDASNMKEMVLCPGFDDSSIYTCKKKTCSECSTPSCKLKTNCRGCYDYVHFLSLRMGCISAEEFLFVLNQQIDLFFRGDKQIRHLVIDDLQQADFSFPLLKYNELFLSALVTFCRDKGVDLTILCDKKASLTQELCSLADNVVCFQREASDICGKVSMYVERSAYQKEMSRIIKCEVEDIKKVFKCDNSDSEFCYDDSNVMYKEIGSMKLYWRQSINALLKDRETI